MNGQLLLRSFAGPFIVEAGDVLRISPPMAYRNWKSARAWLREALEKQSGIRETRFKRSAHYS
jgi:hypothetical protein